MDLSIFLAQVLGINLLILSLSMLINAKQFNLVVEELCERQALSFLMGVVLLAAGSLLVLSHNVWDMSWAVVVTIVSWSILLKGVMYLLVPGFVRRVTKQVFHENKEVLYIGGVINLLLALFLCYEGFVV